MEGFREYVLASGWAAGRIRETVKPYYEQSGITIYHGDCREILPTIPAESVDLIVTDPPYGVRWLSESRRIPFDAIAGDESQEAAITGLSLALPCLRRMRHVYVFGRYELSDPAVGEWVELIWDKGNMGAGDITAPWGIEHEYIQFGVCTRSPGNVSRNGKGRTAARLRKGSVLRFDRVNGAAISRHPSEKPVRLLRELIESSSMIGETVFDPFCGVGSTLVAARLEGRCGIGIELEEKYCEIAARRLQQDSLFTEAVELTVTGDGNR